MQGLLTAVLIESKAEGSIKTIRWSKLAPTGFLSPQGYQGSSVRPLFSVMFIIDLTDVVSPASLVTVCMQMIVKPRGSFNVHAIMNRFKMS